jgi:transcriptional antiterminator NusG
MTEILEKKWYVVRAVSGQEHKIKGYIESEVSRLGFGDYLEETEKKSTKKKFIFRVIS